ncbi:MAG: hypothetical protein RLZZ534_141 [Actinomycetota bacterium]
MNLFLKRNAPVFYMALAMIVLYAPWMGRGYVNLEYPFSMAARGLSDSRFADQLDAYFGVQANPLGYSFVLAVIYKIFGYHDWFWLAKLPSLCGALMIIVSGWMLTRDRWHGRRSLFYFWSSLIILNPLFVAFATSSTADVLHIGLLMLAIAIAFESKNDSWVMPTIASLIFGLAVITKYIPMYFGLAFIAIAVLGKSELKRNPKLIWRDITIYVLVPGAILVFYIWWLYVKYSVFISYGLGPGKPDFFDVPKFLVTFGKYLAFIGLCCGPVSLVLIFKNFNKLKNRILGFLLMSAAIVLGIYMSTIRVDEMDFGGGFPFGVNVLRGIQTIGFVIGLSVLTVLFKSSRSSDRMQKVMIFGISPSLVMISLTLPTQRYIMIIIPAAMILLVDASSALTIKVRNLALGATAFGFALVSLLGMSYLRAQGNASENMAVWMEENGVIEQSAPGAIFPHARQHFYGLAQSEIKYDVTATSLDGEKLIKERILHREPMNVLGRITRVYVLYELPKKP